MFALRAAPEHDSLTGQQREKDCVPSQHAGSSHVPSAQEHILASSEKSSIRLLELPEFCRGFGLPHATECAFSLCCCYNK